MDSVVERRLAGGSRGAAGCWTWRICSTGKSKSAAITLALPMIAVAAASLVGAVAAWAQPSTTVGVGEGFAGDRVEIAVTLSANGARVGATSNDILFDNSRFGIAPSSDCRINQAIGPGSLPDKNLVAERLCTNGRGVCTTDDDCTAPNRCNLVRVGIYGLNDKPIPDGELFRCSFTIDPTASPGVYALSNSCELADPFGLVLSGTTCIDGQITVRETITQTPTPSVTATFTLSPTSLPETPTRTPTPTLSPTHTSTSTPSPTQTTAPSSTPTLTASPTVAPTNTPSVCPQRDLGSALPVVVEGNTADSANILRGQCGGEGAPEHTYQWTAPFTGTYVLDTFGSGFDTVLYALDGGCGGRELGCNDDAQGSYQSQLVLDLRAGQTIIVVVDGYGSASGPYRLSIDLSPEPPPTVSRTPTFVCTPPPCPDGTLFCPSECPGGCGTICLRYSPTLTLTPTPTSTFTPTPTPSGTRVAPSPTRTATRTPTTRRSCSGDCNNDGRVTIDEVIRMVNIALGNAELRNCPVGDLNGDGQITIDEIIRSVNVALNGCPS